MNRHGIRDAKVFVPQTTRIPAWLENRGAKISLGHLDLGPLGLNRGLIIYQVVIHSAQVNFSDRGSTVIRHSGSEVFKPLFPSGIVLAITDPEGELVLNRHLCRVCFKNTGWFVRDGADRKIVLSKRETSTCYQFVCPDCGYLWGVSLPKNGNDNGNGNGHDHDHGVKHQSHCR